MPKKAKAELKAKLEAEPKKRRFRGWKATLSTETEEFSINVPIRYQKITSKPIDKAMNIITKSRSLKAVVQRKLLGDYHYGYVIQDKTIVNKLLDAKIEELRKKGKWETTSKEEFDEIVEAISEVQKEDVAYYQVIDGKESEVQPFDKTSSFDITNFIEKEKLWNYLLEGFYEIWSEKNGLWLLADYLQRQSKIAVCDHIVLRKSFKEQYGLIFPVVIDNEYTFVMALTRMNLQFNHMKPAKPLAEAKAEAKKATPLRPKSVLKVDLFGSSHK